MKWLHIGWALLWMSALPAWAQRPQPWRIRQVLGLFAEHGIVAFRGNQISVFSPKNIGVVSTDGNDTKYVRTKSGIASWVFAGDSFKRVRTHIDVSYANDPGLCDRLNQIDLSPIYQAAGKALPPGARVKSLEEYGCWALAIYSTSQEPVRYEIYIALLHRRSDLVYRLIDTIKVSDAGYYCGMYQLGKGDWCVLVDEPAASSNYLAAYVYSLTP